MCIAFDGAYILEAPAADPGLTDEHRPVPEITPAGTGGSGRPESLPPTSPPADAAVLRLTCAVARSGTALKFSGDSQRRRNHGS
jgi:hypothetical protein